MQTNIGILLAGIVILVIVLALLYRPPGRKTHERQSFAAHEVVLYITHPAATDSTELVAAIESFLRSERNDTKQKAASKWRTRLQPPTADSNVLTFPSPEGVSFSLVPISLVPFSLIPIRLTGHRKNNLRPNDVIRVLKEAYAELPNGSLALGNGIDLQSISPNWFAKNLYHGGSTGGPGSWPLEVPAPVKLGTLAASKINEHEFRVAGSISSLKPIKDRIRKGKVHVAILDTAPSNNLVQAAQGLMPASAVAGAGSSLIQYLFTTPSSNFEVHPYSNPGELTSLNAFTPPPSHYEMADHGTFVAGIIHTIAPDATVHLYEVLNSFGLGTLTSIAQGLMDAINDHLNNPKRRNTSLIINCSFMLDSITQDGESNLNQILNLTSPDNSDSLTKTILGVLRWVTSRENVVVVAAAGNEAKPGVRPYASYPAAFHGVVGVGSLPKEYPTHPSGRYAPASYSNFSYDPKFKLPGDGFMTFGGELDFPKPLNGDPISTQGVLGVYVGQLPSRDPANVNNLLTKPSGTGWARWAGTSFAAPIVTGLLAARPGQLVRSSKTFKAPFFTAEGENVIPVQQG